MGSLPEAILPLVQIQKSDDLKEKCGVLGISSTQNIDLKQAFAAWQKLQHRGVDAAGAVWRRPDGTDTTFKQLGTIARLFSAIEDLLDDQERVSAAVFHNRYTTCRSLELGNVQPILASNERFSIILAHNGNLPEKCLADLTTKIDQEIPEDSSDSSIMAWYLLQQRSKYCNWADTLMHTLPHFQGAFSLVLMTEDRTMYAIRDPWGIRPLALAQTDTAQVVASESVAFADLGAQYQRELKPGEIRIIPPSGPARSLMYAVATPRPCALEAHYFAHAQSYDGEDKNWHKRFKLGEKVAQRFLTKNITGIDFVVPVLNSGLHVAQGFAAATGLPLIEAIKRNPDSGRSFIKNTDAERRQVVNEKHILDGEILTDKVIVVADDSLVRGTSLEILFGKIRDLHQHAPRAIHLVLGSPPVVNPCDLGVAIARQGELLAAEWQELPLAEIEAKVAQFMGIDSVTFSARTVVADTLTHHHTAGSLCDNCFGGTHPLAETEQPPLYRSEVEAELAAQKILFLASGTGSNVQALLAAIDRGDILAQPLGVITNNPHAGVIAKAESFGVPTVVFESKGRTKNPADREAYFQEIIDFIVCNPAGLPDLVVLAGWNLIVPDIFVEQFTTINLHPALLTGRGEDTVMTSQGKVPEVRGAHAIDTIFALDRQTMPVTGVTVHTVQPSNGVDTGTVIIKAEVPRFEHDTLESLSQRIHAVEHDVFPTAVQFALLQELVTKGQKVAL